MKVVKSCCLKAENKCKCEVTAKSSKVPLHDNNRKIKKRTAKVAQQSQVFYFIFFQPSKLKPVRFANPALEIREFSCLKCEKKYKKEGFLRRHEKEKHSK